MINYRWRDGVQCFHWVQCMWDVKLRWTRKRLVFLRLSDFYCCSRWDAEPSAWPKLRACITTGLEHVCSDLPLGGCNVNVCGVSLMTGPRFFSKAASSLKSLPVSFIEIVEIASWEKSCDSREKFRSFSSEIGWIRGYNRFTHLFTLRPKCNFATEHWLVPRAARYGTQITFQSNQCWCVPLQGNDNR